MAFQDQPGYKHVQRKTKIVSSIEDTSFDNKNTQCTDLQILSVSKAGLDQKYKNSFAISRTLNALNFIDIKGKTVHTLMETKN